MHLLEQIQSLNFPATLPKTLLTVEQRFDTAQVSDVVEATQTAFEESGLLTRMSPGDTVAVGVGSRGIANLPIIVKSVVDCLQAAGLKPFITPAMGSHGGATAAGQKTTLAKLGITAGSVGAEIRATMEVIQIGQIPGAIVQPPVPNQLPSTSSGNDTQPELVEGVGGRERLLPGGPALFQDTLSASADHTLLIGRVKPHTSFRSRIESGLAKMAVIGLGKQHGAATMHSMGVAWLKQHIASGAHLYAENSNLVGGLAIVENAYHQTARIAGLTAAEIGGPKEAALLEQAKALLAKIPFEEIDILVVRQMGKNISGTGMDTNVIGQLKIPGQPENFGGPDITIISVLDLTDKSYGNCTGLGLANVTTARLAKKIDWQAFYTNALTSGILNMSRACLPMTMPDDKRAVQAALRGCGRPQAEAGLVFIQDTMTLDQLWVSPNLQTTVEPHSSLSIVDEVPLTFAENGNMISPWALT